MELEAAARCQDHNQRFLERGTVTNYIRARELGKLGRLSSAQLMSISQQEAHGHVLARQTGRAGVADGQVLVSIRIVDGSGCSSIVVTLYCVDALA